MKKNHATPVRLECATEEEIAARGAGKTLRAGISETPFGYCLIGVMPRGISHLSFFDDDDSDRSIQEMQAAWPMADIVWDHSHAAEIAAQIFVPSASSEWPVYVRGTLFQLRVWSELLRIPAGSRIGYGKLAEAVGKPNASRAVGSAVGKNEVSFLIPCHRVIRADGACGNYRWGPLRKRAMLDWEKIRQK